MIATNDRARLFLMPRGASDCLSEAVYVACVGIDGLTQDGGEVNKIECPNPNGYGYKEIGVYRGEIGRMTTTFTGRLSLSELSLFRDMFDSDCPVDAHVHWGACTELDNFNQYSIAWVMRNVYITNWGTDPIIAMQSADRNTVNETVDVSIGEFFQIKSQLIYAQRHAGMTSTGTIVDAVVCGRRSCASDLCPPSRGCDKMYVLMSDHRIEYTSDNGATWTSILIPIANRGVGPLGIACSGRNVVVFYADGVVVSISRGDIDLIRVGAVLASVTWLWRSSDLGFNIVAFADGAGANIGAMLILDDVGGLWRSADRNDPSCGVTKLDDAGTAVFNAAHANDGVLVAVGDDGAVYSYRQGSAFAQALDLPTAADLNTVIVKSAANWLVGGAAGELWCTNDSGLTWTRVCFPGYNAATPPIVTDLCMSNQHVLWMAAGGVIYRSIDGGGSWTLEPNSENAIASLALRNMGIISGIACCEENPNLVWGFGLVDVTPDPDTMLLVLGSA